MHCVDVRYNDLWCVDVRNVGLGFDDLRYDADARYMEVRLGGVAAAAVPWKRNDGDVSSAAVPWKRNDGDVSSAAVPWKRNDGDVSSAAVPWKRNDGDVSSAAVPWNVTMVTLVLGRNVRQPHGHLRTMMTSRLNGSNTHRRLTSAEPNLLARRCGC